MVCYAPLLSVHGSPCAENCFCAISAVSLSCVVLKQQTEVALSGSRAFLVPSTVQEAASSQTLDQMLWGWT